MRAALALLLLVPALPAQETAVADAVFTIALEQGWSFTAEGERALFQYSERDLLQGLQPTLRLARDASDPRRPTLARPVPPRESEVPPPTFRREKGDPLKIDGSLTLRGDGSAVFSFKKLEYWDSGQRWWIEFEAQKIRTLDLGGVNKWSGTRKEWAARLDDLEKSAVELYLKAVTPQKPEAVRAHIGLNTATPESGKRLFVTLSLEEQLAVLLIARLDGAVLEKNLWPPETARYPVRSIQIARSMVDRIVAQCAGELAPAKARQQRSRSVKDQVWDGRDPAVPSFSFDDGAAWAVEMGKPFQEARRRLTDLAAQSSVNGGYLEPDWSALVRREVQALEEATKVVVPARAPTVQDPLLVPRLLDAGKGTFDFKEDLDVRDGKVVSSKADARGLVKDAEIAFFQSGANRWRAGKARLETWYRAEVKRKP